MKVLLAKTAGFCYGVNRAVEILSKETENNKEVYTLGPIIHNPNVIADFEKKGVKIIDSVNDVVENSTVIIRSHGVSKDVISKLTEKNAKIIDATCPFVKKIHNIVEKFYEMSYNIIIVGDKDHPEVQGILGWCNNSAYVIDSIEQLKLLNVNKKSCVVSQTTFSQKIWKEIKNYIKANCNSFEVIDTICDSTQKRQEEISELCKSCNSIIVIGGMQSSNTKKLYSAAKAHCENVIMIENAEQLDTALISGECVGVTAGASTPAYIIKEVIELVEEKELNFAEALENTLKPLNTGDVVKGTVIKLTPTEVYVDLDTKADGVIPADQVSIRPDVKPEDVLKVGQEIEAFVVRVNDVEGVVTLSMRKLESISAQKEFVEAFDNGTPVDGVVTEVVKGGIIVMALGTKVFVPASLATERRTEDLSVLLRKKVTLKIIELDKRKRKVIGSIKAVLVEDRKTKSEAFWSTIEVGKKIKGVVKSVTNFGAFVDVGGVDGLVHVTELTWKRIKHPSEFVKPGDILEVTVLDFDKETKKISLGCKKSEDNPWLQVEKSLHEGDVVDCKIVGLMPFGAFAEIFPGVDGLIHISQIANKKIGKPADVLTIGQEVKAKVVEINNETLKIGLSMRALLEDTMPVEETAEQEVVNNDYTEDTKDSTIGEMVDMPEVNE